MLLGGYMNDIYIVDKNFEKILNCKYTYFLDSKLQKLVKRKLKRIKYDIYIPYKDSEKVIFYNGIKPNILLYEIKCKYKLKHQDIMGTLFSLGIDPSMYGDILIIDDKYYIYVLDIISNYLINNLTMINNNKVELVNIDINYLNAFERKYEELEYIVSSERVDTIISNIIHSNRKSVDKFIKDKCILVNYDIPKCSYNLKVGDILSIRKYGKYKYNGVIKTTKKNNYIVRIDKYV